MRYIKSRSEFLNHKKHNLILEGGLENTINWGDSVVGRLFASIFRVAKMGVDIKRIDGAGNTLRKLFLDATKEGFKDPKKRQILETIEENIKLTGYVDGLIEQLKTGNVKNIQQYIIDIPDDVTPEVLSIISGSYNFVNPKSPKPKDGEIIDVLLSIESWKEEEGSNEENSEGEKSNDNNVENKEENNSEIENSIYDDIKENLLSLKRMLLSQKQTIGNEEEFKRGDKVKVKNDDQEYVYLSGENEIKPGNDNKLNTSDDEIGKEISDDESFIGIDKREIGKKVKTNDIKKIESLLIEGLLHLIQENISSNSVLLFDSIKNISNGETINSKLPSGTELNIKPDSIDWMIKNLKNQLGVYKVVYSYIKKGNSLSVNDNYEKRINKFIENRSNKIPGEGTRSRIWRECLIGKKLSDLYKSIEKFDDYKKLGKFGEYIEPFKNSMDIILSKLEKYTNESFSKNESILSDFEQKDNNDTKIEVDNNKISNIKKNKEEYIEYSIWFNNKILPIQKNLKNLLKNVESEKEELEKEVDKNIYIIDVIEIVKIFKKASRLYIKTRIPSNRTGGKLTTFRANNWEKIDGGSVDPDRPGEGPFRNIKLYEKWSKIVLDIINEFDYMLKRDASMVKLSDNSKPFKPKKSIYDFIIDALEGDKISGVGKGMKSESNQLEFLRGYFGEVPKELSKEFSKLGYDNDSSKPKSTKLFEEVNKISIDDKQSNLYKLTKSGGLSFKTNSQIYLYYRVSDSNKAIYIFEDDDIIKGKIKDSLKFDFKSNSYSEDYFYMSLLGNDIEKGDFISDFDVIKKSGDKSENIKTKDFKIEKIEKYLYDNKRLILNFPIKGFDKISNDSSKIVNKFKSK